MRPLKKAIFAGAMLATSSFSHAGLIGVQHVVITSALAAMGNSEGYIQVGEFEAFETGSGINVAHQANGGSASSLSFWGAIRRCKRLMATSAICSTLWATPQVSS
ncbi:hypothetical protein [Neptunomonas marina]|uniref:Uncharacterized protein n=1 Tax=Neptunomonas marina TaxID=1815562 RepID=A0A437Q4Y3_9GAMM|nr:hypothetical protein [Neptunomonas marina]RVU29560.1 hypothetical protein EOE65_15425 [Neptunomonas marina]